MSESIIPAVLIVDDARTSRMVAEKAIQSDQYRVITVSSGEEALAQASDPGVFLVVMDVNMPGLSGFETAQRLRSDDPSRRLPIIFLTAMDQQADLTFRGYEAGAVDFIYKPLHPEIFRSKVNNFYELFQRQAEINQYLKSLEEANKKFTDELRERKRMEQVVQESEVRYRSLLELSPVSIIVETGGKMRYVNTAVLKTLGVEEREALLDRSLVDFVHEKFKAATEKSMNRIIAQGGRAEPFETELIRPNGEKVDVEVFGACVVYEGEIGIQMALQDVTERKLIEAEWRRLSRMDGLTGIYNRRAFDDIIERELRRAQRNKAPLAIAMIDIDSFKLYNDNYGHQKGDETLKAVATVLHEGAERGGDHVARYGGEEFAVIMADTDMEGAKQVAETLRQSVEALAIPHAHNLAAKRITISTGVYGAVPGETATASDFIQRADANLYKAKRSGKNRVVSDDPTTTVIEDG